MWEDCDCPESIAADMDALTRMEMKDGKVAGTYCYHCGKRLVYVTSPPKTPPTPRRG